MRAGPGLGGIQPSQGDYYQATRGGGNGDYNMIVYAPESIEETLKYIQEGFEVAEYYRNPVMVLVDGLIGQMMESVDPNVEVKNELVRIIIGLQMELLTILVKEILLIVYFRSTKTI